MSTTRTGMALAFVAAVAGIALAEAALGFGDWLWLALPLVGVALGTVVGQPSRVWTSWLIGIAGDAVAVAAGFGALPGPYWYLLLAGHLVVLTVGFIPGTSIGRPDRPLTTRWRRSVIAIVAVSVLGLAAYSGVIGVVYSAEYVTQAGATDCRTPGSAYGWTYEAINYDIADDARLLAANRDPLDCSSQGSRAGTAVTSSDGTPIAGWYIPAAGSGASPTTPTGPTLVLVHGGKSNKSGMLKYAVPLHADYNLVLIDLRNSGRSGGDMSSGGLHEQHDLRAMIDWLERTKQPSWIGLVGNSNGAATSLAEAATDSRVRALLLDSMHASIVTQLGNIAETEPPHLPAWPGALAVIVGASVRLGGDLTSVDPVRTIRLVGDRPVVLLHGSIDHVDRPRDSLERNVQSALAAGVNVTFHVCDGADHGAVIDHCGAAWATWATNFFAEARAG